MKGSCMNDGTVLTHFNARKSNFVADSCNNSRDDNEAECFGRPSSGEVFRGSSVLVTSTISSSLGDFDWDGSMLFKTINLKKDENQNATYQH